MPPDATVDVVSAQVPVDVGPRLGKPGTPVLEECVGFEAGGVLAGGERHGGGGHSGLVGLVEDVALGVLSGSVTVERGDEVLCAGVEDAFEVAVGERCSSGGHNVGDACFVRGDSVGVPLDYARRAG